MTSKNNHPDSLQWRYETKFNLILDDELRAVGALGRTAR